MDEDLRLEEREWISVNDRLPELGDGKYASVGVLVSDGERVIPMDYCRDWIRGKEVLRFKWRGVVFMPWNIAYWMPLPPPPEKGVKG
jgi:hypothetical protein